MCVGNNKQNPMSQLRVGVAGLGVVGGGAALALSERNDAYQFAAGLVRNLEKTRDFELKGALILDSQNSFLEQDLDIVIDALPDGAAGAALIDAALRKGVGVISANKQALAGAVGSFHALAARNHTTLAYSASVGGGAPMVETVREAAQEGVKSIEAILNGTVNFILTKVASGESFEAAIMQAQSAGFAEPDPSADLSGDDARAKISILSFEAFGRELAPESIKVEALDEKKVAEIVEKGGVWRQIAELQSDESGNLSAHVGFREVTSDSYFRDIRNEGNALRLTTETMKNYFCAGKGAGRAPTVSSLMSDLHSIAPAIKRRRLQENAFEGAGA